MTDRSIDAVIARLRFGDSDGDDHDIAAAEIERLRGVIAEQTRAVVALNASPGDGSLTLDGRTLVECVRDDTSTLRNMLDLAVGIETLRELLLDIRTDDEHDLLAIGHMPDSADRSRIMAYLRRRIDRIDGVLAGAADTPAAAQEPGP